MRDGRAYLGLQDSITFLLLFLYTSSVPVVSSEKCYSCSSAHLHTRWPKDDQSNRLQFLREFPWYANESCDQVKNLLPVVDCTDSVCIKAVITEPPAKRDVCVQSGAIVRDCWSRVVGADGNLAMDPKARKNMVKMSVDMEMNRVLGVIHTCYGYLCNSSVTSDHFVLISFLLLPFFY